MLIEEEYGRLVDFLRSVPGVEISERNPETAARLTPQCFLRTTGTVVWSRRKKSQWGCIRPERTRLFIQLDFPAGSYTVTEIANRLGLPEVGQHSKTTGVSEVATGLRPPFKSVKLMLYPSWLEEHDVLSSEFTSFLVEVLHKSCRWGDRKEERQR